MCNIEQMFHSFHVDPNHKDFLCFLWFENNKLGKPIAEYQMNIHLFGNSPSPAVATFGLKKTATDGKEEFGEDAMKFVHQNFYVDDGLASLPTAEQAMALLRSGAWRGKWKELVGQPGKRALPEDDNDELKQAKRQEKAILKEEKNQAE